MNSSGVVASWSDDQGWGVIDSHETPGGCWVHFSVISSDSGEYRSLTVGQTVKFAWELADQDGFKYRAMSVNASPDARRLVNQGEETSSAYGSTLTIEYDDDGGGAR